MPTSFDDFNEKANRSYMDFMQAVIYHRQILEDVKVVHGFTGTSICIDPNTETIVILLTNAVHIPNSNSIRLRLLVGQIGPLSIEKL